MTKHHMESIFSDMTNDITYIKMETLINKFRSQNIKKWKQGIFLVYLFVNLYRFIDGLLNSLYLNFVVPIPLDMYISVLFTM